MSLKLCIGRSAILFCAAIVFQAWGADPAQTAAPVAQAVPQVTFDSTFFTIPVAVADKAGLSRAANEKGSLWPTILSTTEASSKIDALLASNQGVALLSAPRVTTRSGQRAVVETIREFHYPTSFKPASETKDRVIPVQFETRNAGVTLEVEPKVGPDGTLDLNAVVNVTAFDGWQTYADGRNVSAQPKAQAPGAFQLPVFSTTRMPVAVTMRFGQTLLLGGLPRTRLNRLTIGDFLDGQETTKKADPQPDLLFVAISVSETKGMAEATRQIALDGPVEINSQVVTVPRAKLADTAFGVLTKEIQAEPSSGAEPVLPAPAPPSPGLAGVLKPGTAENLVTTLRGMAGVQFLNGPQRKIDKGGVYTPAAADYIPEPAGTREPNREVKGRQSAALPPIAIDLMVTPAVKEESTIDLDIRMRQIPNAADAKAGKKGRFVTTTVSIFDGQTVIFSSPDPKRKDNVVLLLIRAQGDPLLMPR
jgi:Bacterial type II and III secretion system protein